MANTPSDRMGSATDGNAFVSRLPEARQRFLAHVIEHAFACGRRTPADFLRHFPPAAIMQALQDHPDLRANILEVATGVRHKIAAKKSAEACGVDLQIALDEGETQPLTVVEQFQPDDRVRFLEARKLWLFLSEGAFWTVTEQKDRARHAVAAEHIAFVIDRALGDQLLTHRDVVEGITVSQMSERLPRTELGMLLAAALKMGGENKPFVERSLLGVTPVSTLVRHIPLEWIWEQVVIPRIAEAHGYVLEPSTISPPIQPPLPLGAASGETELEVNVTMEDGDSGASPMDVEVEVPRTLDRAVGNAKTTSPGAIPIPRPVFKRG